MKYKIVSRSSNNAVRTDTVADDVEDLQDCIEDALDGADSGVRITIDLIDEDED